MKLSALVAAGLLTIGLVACGDNEAGDDADDTTEVVTPAPEPAPAPAPAPGDTTAMPGDTGAADTSASM